ncbi:MAG: PH domain-containing protein [Thermofilaceae archaeon]
MSQVIWTGKPYMRKTVVKFATLFIVLTLFLFPLFIVMPFAFLAWILGLAILFPFYYYYKSSFTYYITDKSVRIEQEWSFGSYSREVTFDQIRDVHVFQGVLARVFNCGSVAFVTSAGLEVAYAYSGVGTGRVGPGVGVGQAQPQVVKGRKNMFWDIHSPNQVGAMISEKLAEWREVVQQRRIAASMEKMTGAATPQRVQPAHILDELERLKRLLDEGAITKEEYEKLKKKLLED